MKRILGVLVLVALVGLALTWAVNVTGTAARWEAARSAARAEELEAQARLWAAFPLAVASLKDSLLVVLAFAVNQVIVLVLVIQRLLEKRGGAQ